MDFDRFDSSAYSKFVLSTCVVCIWVSSGLRTAAQLFQFHSLESSSPPGFGFASEAINRFQPQLVLWIFTGRGKLAEGRGRPVFRGDVFFLFASPQHHTRVWLIFFHRRGYTGVGPCFHLSGFHFGTGLLSHSHMYIYIYIYIECSRGTWCMWMRSSEVCPACATKLRPISELRYAAGGGPERAKLGRTPCVPSLPQGGLYGCGLKTSGIPCWGR